jgi:hypothetical protein
MLESRYEWMKDLEEAIRTSRQVVESMPSNGQASCSISETSLRVGEMKNQEALRYLYDAWACTNAVPFYAAHCLRILATQHKIDPSINLGRAVLELLPIVHTKLLDRNDQQFVMSTFAGVASDLCGSFLSSNQPNEALEYLEQGRGIIVNQLLDRHTDISDLIIDHPTLAQQYERLVNEVNTPLRQTTHDTAEVRATKRRREAATELNTCIRTIRGIPDH